MTAVTTETTPTAAEQAIRRVAIIALLAILLGFVMQGLILGTKLATGAPFPGMRLIVDLAQGVTWSFLVCAGVGIGTTVAKGRAAIAGLISALFAPVAIAAAKSSQKVMAGLIGAADQPAVLSLATISVLRAIQYGILGWLLATLVQKGRQTALPYLASGAGVGIIFGGTIAGLTYQATVAAGVQPGLPQIAASIVNEVIFPIGCATVIFVGQVVSRNLKTIIRSGSA